MATSAEFVQRLNHRTFSLWAFALFGLHIVGLSLFAVYRFVDWDEGFYLQAGRSIAGGLQLYSDFFYPQAPLYPQLLALLPGSGWDYWLQARFVSVFFSAVTMALVGLSVKRILLFSQEPTKPNTQRNASKFFTPILLALALYSVSGLFLAWNTVAKPLALSQFFLMSGVLSRLMAHKQEAAKREFFWLFLSGASLALAAQTRSPMLVAWVVTLFSVIAATRWRKQIARAALFISGSLLAALPTLMMALRDSGRFYFDNFGFHLARTEPPNLIDILSDKLNFITRTAFDPQLAVIALLTVIIIFATLRRHATGSAWQAINYYPLAVGITIIGAYFMAFPSHRQYVTQGLPTLIVFAAAHSDSLRQWVKNMNSRFRRRVPALIAAVYLLGALPYCWVYFTASRTRDKRCEQVRVSSIVSIIQQHSNPSDTILAELPIYAVLANRPQAPRAEFVGFEYKSLALGEKYAEMNLADSAYIANLVKSQTLKLVVVENIPDVGLSEALQGNYQKIFDDNFSQVWQVKTK